MILDTERVKSLVVLIRAYRDVALAFDNPSMEDKSDEVMQWLDLYIAETEDPARVLAYARRLLPDFEPTRFLHQAITETGGLV